MRAGGTPAGGMRAGGGTHYTNGIQRISQGCRAHKQLPREGDTRGRVAGRSPATFAKSEASCSETALAERFLPVIPLLT
ncbi:MAG: hypothetical protein ACM3NP_05310 [Actinomycetota bacterium]